MIFFYCVSAIVFTIWVFSFIKGLVEIYHNPHIVSVSNAKNSPKISIVIPVRNEERRVSYLLSSIERQSYINLEVIVVDDNSEDKTVEVVSSFSGKIKNLKIIKSVRQEGWCGKNSALVEGFKHTSEDSEWILFIDADCELKENALNAIVDFAIDNSIDCLSLFPEVKNQRFFERLLLPSIGAIVTLFNSPKKVNSSLYKDAFLNGQFIFIRRRVYIDVGTHEIVKDAVLEDAALALEIKKKGYKIFLGFGENVFLIRMYESLGEFIDGWTKNLYLIIGKRILNLVKMMFIIIVLSYIPVIWLIYGIISVPATFSYIFIAGYIIVLFFQMCLRHISGTYPLYALLAPISSTIISYIGLRSAYRYIAQKGVDWKGRKYFASR
ncbi:MAG: glycosyltransferase family 2 protein [Candidatus Anstonellales archaeon]